MIDIVICVVAGIWVFMTIGRALDDDSDTSIGCQRRNARSLERIAAALEKKS